MQCIITKNFGMHHVASTMLSNDTLNQFVQKEIIESQIEEIVSELNIPLDSIHSHKLHAIIEAPFSRSETWNRPVCYFITKTKLNKNEIIDFHKKGGKETDEIEEIDSWELGNAKENFLNVDGEALFSPSGLIAVGIYLLVNELIEKHEFDKIILSCLAE